MRRVHERLDNLEEVTNSQSISNGRTAPAPPTAALNVSVNPSVKGHAFIRVVNPEFLPSPSNPVAATIRHWIQASPNAAFNGNVTDFGVTHQTYIDTAELGSGTYYFRLRSTFDGKTFNNPVSSGKVVIP